MSLTFREFKIVTYFSALFILKITTWRKQVGALFKQIGHK